MARIPIVFFFCAVISACSSVTTGADQLQKLDDNALTAFLVPFRERILQKVAVAWNHTITDSARLKVGLQTCSDQIKGAVDTCKACATNTCQQDRHAIQHSPTFKDYLKLALRLTNPYEYLKEPLNEVGNSLGDLVDLLGDGSESFIDSMAALGDSVGGAFTGAFHGLETGIYTVKDAFLTGGGTVIDGITDVGNSIGDIASQAGNAVVDAGKSIVGGIAGLFGRKRAAISPELQRCMEPCPTCSPLLLPDRRDMITKVCGADIVQFNDTVRSNVLRIKGIFAAVSSKDHPVIAEIEYDPTSLSGLSYTRVYITANVKGRYVRYWSAVVYDMVNVGSTAAKVADEFWQLWAQ